MKITVIGTGYVGLVTGACFAEMGNNVTCIDIDEKKVEMLKEGKSPIYEPGLEDILKRIIEDNRIHFTSSYAETSGADVIFMAVGTPPREDGSADLKYIFASLDSLIPNLIDGQIIVLKSTVPVGTHLQVKNYIKEKTTKNIFVVNNPEFLKEGSAVKDFMQPERIVIGTDSEDAFDKMEKLYRPFSRQRQKMIKMSNLSAEMTKYAANCFLATKISFINDIARLCDATGADIEEVRHGISTDSRIGSQFLYAGPGYGGSCFPKDVKALLKTAKDVEGSLQVVQAAEDVNDFQKTYLVSKIKKHFNGDLKGKKFALWGVAFKANTDDIRETPAIPAVEMLTKEGAEVCFYDPVAANNFEAESKELGLNATKNQNKYDTLNGKDGLIVLTEWKEFRQPDFSEIKSRLSGGVVFDGRNLYIPETVEDVGLAYYGIGKGRS